MNYHRFGFQDISISDWTQDELDALYKHWNVQCPSIEALKEKWKTSKKEKEDSAKTIQDGQYGVPLLVYYALPHILWLYYPIFACGSRQHTL